MGKAGDGGECCGPIVDSRNYLLGKNLIIFILGWGPINTQIIGTVGSEALQHFRFIRLYALILILTWKLQILEIISDLAI